MLLLTLNKYYILNTCCYSNVILGLIKYLKTKDASTFTSLFTPPSLQKWPVHERWLIMTMIAHMTPVLSGSRKRYGE